MPQVMNVGYYAASCLSLYLLFGIAWYFLDRLYGTKMYRWFYNVFHDEPMPENIERGFMYNQGMKRKTAVAFYISTAQSLYMVIGVDVNIPVEIIMWLLEVPAMLIGFGIGTFVFKVFLKRDKIFTVLDAAGEKAGEINVSHLRQEAEGVGKSVLSVIGSVPSGIRRFWREYVVNVDAPVQTMPPVVRESVPVARKEEPPEPSPSEILNRFTRRG